VAACQRFSPIRNTTAGKAQSCASRSGVRHYHSTAGDTMPASAAPTFNRHFTEWGWGAFRAERARARGSFTLVRVAIRLSWRLADATATEPRTLHAKRHHGASGMLRHACGYALANAGHDTRALQSRKYPEHDEVQCVSAGSVCEVLAGLASVTANGAKSAIPPRSNHNRGRWVRSWLRQS
jgi:hypothetical protein